MDITVYNGSKKKINFIDYQKCHLGWHAGNLCQAIDIIEPRRLSDSYGWDDVYVYVSEIDVTDTNTITIPDVFLYDYDFLDTIKKTLKACLKNQFPQNDAIYSLDDCYTEEDVRRVLLKNGIKYIRYENKYETKGFSYCILDEEINKIEFTLYDFLTEHIQWIKQK